MSNPVTLRTCQARLLPWESSISEASRCIRGWRRRLKSNALIFGRRPEQGFRVQCSMARSALPREDCAPPPSRPMVGSWSVSERRARSFRDNCGAQKGPTTCWADQCSASRWSARMPSTRAHRVCRCATRPPRHRRAAEDAEPMVSPSTTAEPYNAAKVSYGTCATRFVGFSMYNPHTEMQQSGCILQRTS